MHILHVVTGSSCNLVWITEELKTWVLGLTMQTIISDNFSDVEQQESN
jgi:hypothetical protein